MPTIGTDGYKIIPLSDEGHENKCDVGGLYRPEREWEEWNNNNKQNNSAYCWFKWSHIKLLFHDSNKSKVFTHIPTSTRLQDSIVSYPHTTPHTHFHYQVFPNPARGARTGPKQDIFRKRSYFTLRKYHPWPWDLDSIPMQIVIRNSIKNNHHETRIQRGV